MKVSLGPRDKFPLMSEINMIPLIDVSLVLLIIFMVVTPFLVSTEIKVNLPKAATGEAPSQEPIKIMVSPRALYYLGGNAVAKADLETEIAAALHAAPQAAVLVEADAATPFEHVVAAMDAARQAGAQKLGVSVEPQNVVAGK